MKSRYWIRDRTANEIRYEGKEITLHMTGDSPPFTTTTTTVYFRMAADSKSVAYCGSASLIFQCIPVREGM
jgi:hypothetical protein